MHSFTNLLNQYRRAQDGFDAVVAAVPADRWDAVSACTEWTNRDVLGHVVWGQEFVRHLAARLVYESQAGAPGAPHPAELIPGDPVQTWREARAASVPALTEAALARPIHLRAFGEIPLAGFITALVTDFLAHTWDSDGPPVWMSGWTPSCCPTRSPGHVSRSSAAPAASVRSSPRHPEPTSRPRSSRSWAARPASR